PGFVKNPAPLLAIGGPLFRLPEPSQGSAFEDSGACDEELRAQGVCFLDRRIGQGYNSLVIGQRVVGPHFSHIDARILLTFRRQISEPSDRNQGVAPTSSPDL